MFIDCYRDLTVTERRSGWKLAIRDTDGRAFAQIKLGRIIFDRLIPYRLRREVAGDIENEMHRV